MSGIEPKAIVDIAQTANQFESSIIIKANDRSLDVKSIIGLTVTLLRENSYKLEINGPDEEEAKESLFKVFKKHGLIVEIL